MLKKRYVDTRQGQVHLRYRESASDCTLALLHPMPYGGVYFDTFAELVTSDVRLVVPDYPGCGRSDPLADTPSIGKYADAVADALKTLDLPGPCHLLGFHSGCLVACELSLRYPDLVASIVFADVPLFDDERRQQLRADLSSHKRLSDELSCLQMHWKSDVESRLGVVPIERAFDLFVDHIGAAGDGADGFRAAFDYPVAESLSEITKRTLLLASQSSLRDGTHRASMLIDGAVLQDIPDITRSVFEEGAPAIYRAVSAWLNAFK